MKILLLTVCIAVFLFCLYFYCIMPRFSRKKEAKKFLHYLFAHRGLFTPDQSIPENSMAAFTHAIRHGYGIELDIQLTKDKQVVVFHDHTLTRMCGIDLPVCEMTYEELQKFSLLHTEEKIPLFEDVLKLYRKTGFHRLLLQRYPECQLLTEQMSLAYAYFCLDSPLGTSTENFCEKV